ncbi:MAG: 2'-5' RNA ligase family protein [Candidatus Limnocylindrales bacterium]
MLATGPGSGVLIRTRLPAALERLRHRLGGADVPAHVTLLYPFLPAVELTPDVRAALAEIARGFAPFEVTFAELGRFPGVVYLVPHPSWPFIRLMDAIVTSFPDHPPYGGAFPEVVPHLTLAETDEARLDAVAEAARRGLPFSCHVSAIEVLTEEVAGGWHRRWRLPLGPGVRP